MTRPLTNIVILSIICCMKTDTFLMPGFSKFLNPQSRTVRNIELKENNEDGFKNIDMNIDNKLNEKMSARDIEKLNMIKEKLFKGDGSANRGVRIKPLRSNRHEARRRGSSDSDTDLSSKDSSSSSDELMKWKDEWKLKWHKMKEEALAANISQRGDVINMVAGRPWGVPCGDPNQHDMPWGTCLLPMECEAEYRIYRGDSFCGRTQFVCCALALTSYDTYHGFDAYFSASSLETDSEEWKAKGKNSHERKRINKRRERKRRLKLRRRRKRNIRKMIKKTVKEIHKILNKTYKYGTTSRIKKTKQLKKFVRELKKQYKKDKQSVRDVHEIELHKIDLKIKDRLQFVKGMNLDFFYNSTFRDWIINGTLSKEGYNILRDNYPDLLTEIMARSRRSGVQRPPDYLEYDIEYGLLFF